MTEQYDNSAARHYAAYRPPLHRPILERVLRPNELFHTGLDVGCGTGCSTVALSSYCERVIGLDSSQAMLAAAPTHPKITYLHGELNEHLQLPVQRCDIVTFAGSLFYTKTASMRKALSKFCPPGGTVIVYDFGVHLNEVMATLDADCPTLASNYDFGVNLDDWEELVVEISGSERLVLDASEEQIAHLLLADSNYHEALRKSLPAGDLLASVRDRLESRSEKTQLLADIYFRRYRVIHR